MIHPNTSGPIFKQNREIQLIYREREKRILQWYASWNRGYMIFVYPFHILKNISNGQQPESRKISNSISRILQEFYKLLNWCMFDIWVILFRNDHWTCLIITNPFNHHYWLGITGNILVLYFVSKSIISFPCLRRLGVLLFIAEVYKV